MSGAIGLPDPAETLAFIRSLAKPTVAEVLRTARNQGTVAVQPRCGIGSHEGMVDLLRKLESAARPDILSLTIDSHTRLNRFDEAASVLRSDPSQLNGYPLVTHGWQRGRELNLSTGVPLEIRHGSPEPRMLFDVALAAGITSFEGGGISYNLPYAKKIPLTDSLMAYRDIDALCGELAHAGIIVDRELFGTLTAVLVPPSISLAISVIEAIAAARGGVRCISVAYPQGGNLIQDVAALRAIPVLAARFLPPAVEVFPVLHEFMGVFPRTRRRADQLILYGALTARLGGAAKVVTKTYEEAYGIPSAAANIAGIRTAQLARAPFLDAIGVDEALVGEERQWIEREVEDLVTPLLDAGDLLPAVVSAFDAGTLDVPFSASRYARSAVVPRRDVHGAIRYLDAGGLPFSRRVRQRNAKLLEHCRSATPQELMGGLISDINFFLEAADEGDLGT